jgi:type IV secretory pathway TraG/TraD family ATPase VirD4
LVKEKYNDWWESLTTDEMSDLKSDRLLLDQRMSESVPEARLLKYIEAFIDSFLDLNEKTRSIIDFSFSGFLFRLLRDPIYSLFCSRPCNVFPEDCAKGKIILINLPVKQFHKVGRDCQIMLKYIWQRAMEKRVVNNDTLPVFLWADEAQNFLHEEDPNFLATARSSRIATVYLTQNLPNYKANMGGAGSEHRVMSLLGTLATKIFHANADIETNKYASDLIGDVHYSEKSRTQSYGGQTSESSTETLKIDKSIRPEEFGRLKTGGNANSLSVEAIAHFQSLNSDKKNFLKLEFNQDYKPKN